MNDVCSNLCNCQDIGCFSFCSDVYTGIMVPFDGDYIVIVNGGFVNQVFNVFKYAGEEIVLPAKYLNENNLFKFAVIEASSGERIKRNYSDTASCYQFSTKIVTSHNLN